MTQLTSYLPFLFQIIQEAQLTQVLQELFVTQKYSLLNKQFVSLNLKLLSELLASYLRLDERLFFQSAL